MKVYVDGQEGTTGLQIRDRLAQHGGVEVLEIEAERRKDERRRRELINASDLTFLCLPDAASKEAVGLLNPGNTSTRFLDASSAHRVTDGWVFGLPELRPGQREAIRGAQKVSVNGCHASGFILALAPLVQQGVVPANTPISATSITGFSGGGKSKIAEYEAARENRSLDAARIYSTGQVHKHLPEMQKYTGLSLKPIFIPIIDNFYKGMAVVIGLHASQLQQGASRATVQVTLAKHYRDERFVKVFSLEDSASLESSGTFDPMAANDSNRNEIHVFGNDERMIVVSRLDNLGKGASGAAVQCMNIMLGFDEGRGLLA